ncbi:MAG: hypothetical protein Q8Q32_01585 [bacterium]|nr:hypothetical protein [bacterium]
MQKKILGLILILSFSLVFASNVLAHGNTYYDYSPDPWQSARFAASSASGIEQVFQPRADIALEGFDFWLDNIGASGSISFKILNSLGSVLATESLNLASTAQSAGGTKIHVDLDSNLELSSSNTYSIRFSSYPAGLGIYYADTISRFLTHNEVFVSEFLLGKARINGVDQEFTFKYSLYGQEIGELSEGSAEEEAPAPEDTELFITGAQVASVTVNSVTLTWTTSKAANSAATAREQLNPLYVISSAYDNTMELEHSLTLTGLKKNFSYFADIYSTDSEGETVSSFTIGFQTNDEETVVDEVDEVDEEENSDVISDPDPESSDDEEEDGEGGGSGDGDPAPDGAGQGEDDLALADSDGDGQPDFDFDSEPTVDAPSQPEFIASTGDSNSFSISWDEPSSGAPSSGYRVDVFDAHGNLVKQFILDTNTRIQEISGLGNGAYTVIIYSNNDGVYEKIAFSEFVISEEGSGLRTLFLITAPILLVLALIWFFWRRRKENQ